MKKTVIIMIILTVSMSMVGCKSNNESLGVVDSIVIDENTKDTVNNNSGFKVAKVVDTGVISETIDQDENCFITGGRKIVRYSQLLEGEKSVLGKFEVGSITEKKEGEFNVIEWNEKQIKGEPVRNGLTFTDNTMLVKSSDNKMKIVGVDGDLKDVEPKELAQNITDGFRVLGGEISEDKSAISFSLGNNDTKKLCVINNKNGDYYEIVGEKLKELSKGKINILGIESNKIYMAIYIEQDASVQIGYYENDTFNKLVTFSNNNDIKIQVFSNIIYSNNRILFTGSVEGNEGIYNYDITSKKLLQQLITESVDESYSYLNINEAKDKIIIDGSNKTDVFRQSINTATIDKNLEISNVTNVSKTLTQGDSRIFAGWGNSGEEFYVRHSINYQAESGEYRRNTSFEVYKISN